MGFSERLGHRDLVVVVRQKVVGGQRCGWRFLLQRLGQGRELKPIGGGVFGCLWRRVLV